MRLRAATYNVHGLRAGVGRVAEVLERLQPDVVLLQECGSRHALAALAGELDMAFASSHRLFGRVRNAILVRAPFHVTEAERIDFSRAGRTIPRGVLVAGVRGRGVGLTAASGHLGLSPRERQAHARELTDALAAADGPLVLGVDTNEGPESPAARWIAERLFDAFARAGSGPGDTFPAKDPSARIDVLYVNDRASVRRAWVPKDEDVRDASDHLPVVAELDLPEP